MELEKLQEKHGGEVSGSGEKRVLFWVVMVQFEMPIQEEMSDNL